jgi:RND family efflux transporter MFP subunit
LLLPAASLVVCAGLYSWAGDKAPGPILEAPTAQVRLLPMAETVVATGVIRPVTGAQVNVGSRISGTVVNLPVEIGQYVEKDQVLAELDQSALAAEKDRARAEVALAIPRIELAQSVLRRRQRLAERGLASKEDLDTAARDLAVEQARLEASRAELRSAEILLGYTRITAPISGLIADVSTFEGETVAAGFAAPTFVTIIDTGRLEVLAYVDETDIGRVQVGQEAMFSVDTYPEAEFSAVVRAIQPRAEIRDSVVNYVVRLAFDQSPGAILRPEMTAHTRLLVANRDAVLTVPRKAIKRRDGLQYSLVKREGVWVESPVRTGWRSDHDVEILSGLSAGELVALNTP